MRRAYDSTTASDLPSDGDLYLAYADGRYANVDKVKARFPRKPVVRITVTGRTFDAEMADVEAGDLSPASGAVWAKGKLTRGEFPTLYFPESSRSAVIAALKANGVDPSHVGMFPAQYNGRAQLNQPGDMGKQYLHGDLATIGRTAYSGGHYDVSVVRDYWPGVDPKPRPRPLAATTRVALRLVTRRMNHRTRPLTAHGRELLLACRAALNHALNVK